MDEQKKELDIYDTVNVAVDSSHNLNELLVNIITPIVSGVVVGLVSNIFRKK